jgi:hypothetical protein
MSRCNISDEAGVYIAYGLAPNMIQRGDRSYQFNGIKTLILRHNNLSDETALIISEQLVRPNISLKYLDLSHNKINDAGGECLARSLSKNRSLKYFNLKKNNLKETTGQVFLENLSQNSTLQSLNLSRN